ncbi:RNA polymerase sigma factor [Chitinophaga lutea]
MDKALLHAVAEGNEKAFEEMFHSYRNKIYSIAFRITGSEPVAEEVLLDVFLKVWLKRDQLPEVEHFSAWLFTITRNRVFSILKQMAVRRQAEAVLEPDEFLFHSADPNAALMEKEYRRVLQQAIDRLSPQQKKVYRLIKERGLKREEAALELNLSPETVKRHLSDAMHVIRVHCLSQLSLYGALVVLKKFL